MMASRGYLSPALERRSAQAHDLIRRGAVTVNHQQFDSLSRQELLEHKIADQAAELEQLASDNHRLASTDVALREDLHAAQREVQQLKSHIRSLQTESDIQIRVLLDKIAKMESDIRAGENVKKNYKQAHMEAQGLAKARLELTAKIQQASQELQKVQADAKSVPDLQAELDKLRLEHKRLRATFEHEKASNVEKVEQLKSMEQNLIGMAKEVEKLHAEVLNAEKSACAPNPYTGGGYMSPHPSYSLAHGGGAYVDQYGIPFIQTAVGPAVNGIVAYGSDNGMAATGEAGGGAVSSSAGGAVWGGPYEPSLAPR